MHGGSGDCPCTYGAGTASTISNVQGAGAANARGETEVVPNVMRKLWAFARRMEPKSRVRGHVACLRVHLAHALAAMTLESTSLTVIWNDQRTPGGMCKNLKRDGYSTRDIRFGVTWCDKAGLHLHGDRSARLEERPRAPTPGGGDSRSPNA